MLLLPTQFRFRCNHSTTLALLDVVTSCYDNINDTNYTALLFLDLKKAFDTVKHEILIHKLEPYGIRGVALDLFSSFLTNRFQYLSLHNSKSSKKLITYGVPQGSVLCPFLFTKYINDISSIISTFPRLFADDTCLILKDGKFENLNHTIETEVVNVNKWLKANKLSRNVSKSNAMIFDPKHNLNNKLKTSSAYENSDLGLVSSTKYLNVTIDHCLSFDLHIKNLINKLSRSAGIMAKIKPFLSAAAMLTLYLTYNMVH